MRYKHLVFFDTETTGLQPEQCSIIELAALKVDANWDIVDQMDEFVRLDTFEYLPQKITEITGITSEMLETMGRDFRDVGKRFLDMISDDQTLLIAHNCAFDLGFVVEMYKRHFSQDALEIIKACDYLDTLTIFRDQKSKPHKLSDAITYYGLDDKVKNSHRAIDDTMALFEVTKALNRERPDILRYINIFGGRQSVPELTKIHFLYQSPASGMRAPFFQEG